MEGTAVSNYTQWPRHHSLYRLRMTDSEKIFNSKYNKAALQKDAGRQYEYKRALRPEGHTP